MTNSPSPCPFGCSHQLVKPHRFSQRSVRCSCHEEAQALREVQAVFTEAGSRALGSGCHRSAAHYRSMATELAAQARTWDLKAAVCERIAPGPAQEVAAHLVQEWTGSFDELRSAAQNVLRRSSLAALSPVS